MITILKSVHFYLNIIKIKTKATLTYQLIKVKMAIIIKMENRCWGG